jgi:hypothetical protein
MIQYQPPKIPSQDSAGEHVLVSCKGHIPGPRLLTGLVQGDHSVVLSNAFDLTNQQLWARLSSDASSAPVQNWFLRALGHPPPGVHPGPLFLSGGADGVVLIVPPSQTGGQPQIWEARLDPNFDPDTGGFNFTIENVALRDAGVAARFLDGRTGDGTVGLAPNTNPPFTGTLWTVAGTGT